MPEEKARIHTRITADTLRDLRGHCVQNVKKTNGTVTLDKAVEYQRGGV